MFVKARGGSLRRRFFYPALGIALAASLSACNQKSTDPIQATAATSEAENARKQVQELRTLFDQTWQRRLDESPILAAYMGDGRNADRWDDWSLAAFESRYRKDQQLLAELDRFDRSSLPLAEITNLDLFRVDLENRIAAFQHGDHLMPVSPLEGIQLQGQIAQFLNFDTPGDYQDWLARLMALEVAIDQTIELMKEGVRKQRIRPGVIMKDVLLQIDGLLAGPSTGTLFYEPFRDMPPSVDDALKTQFEIAAQSTIQELVRPALRRLKQYLINQYLPASEGLAVGLHDQNKGDAYYAWLVARHTSTDLTPEAIHDIGLKEVARIERVTREVMDNAGHKGSIKTFRRKLGWNPRYAYGSAAELLTRYRAVAKKIDPELPRLFGKLPRTTYGIREMPKVAARSAPAAYYYPPSVGGTRAGFVYANTYRPKSRAGWETDALIAHEAVPGHHLQMALAAELEDIPEFRRHGLELNAFVEGWGLYAESLMDELGLYDNHGSRFGRASFEMWRAVRLVIDTGLHAKSWTREQAIEYFERNVAMAEEEIRLEVDRYIAMPGQALAYKIGELKIQELRKMAQEKLGEGFDIRAFHDVILQDGPLTLEMLEQSVRHWVRAQIKEQTVVPDRPVSASEEG